MWLMVLDLKWYVRSVLLKNRGQLVCVAVLLDDGTSWTGVHEFCGKCFTNDHP